ncbi:MAG TPA: hypothetical protein VJX67_20025 [Blastocatellia bacterium]|nr:hypothetical protein [Blastocatellia bacterium]
MGLILRVASLLLIALPVVSINAVAASSEHPAALQSNDKNKPANTGANSKTAGSERVYDQSLDETWRVAVHAAYRNFEVQSTDMDKHVIQMWTKASLASNRISVAVTLQKVSDKQTGVKVEASKKSKLFFWGSPARIIRDYFKEMDSQFIPTKP